MSYHCQCPLWGHQPGCPMGNTGGTTTIRTTGTGPPIEPAPCRVPWECSRCRAINAPHVDQCQCRPYDFTPQVVSPLVISPVPNPPWIVKTVSGNAGSNIEMLRDAGFITYTAH